jgi:hypothetical protein
VDLAFDEEGVLPPGDYPMTVDELRKSMLVVGPGETCPGWDAKWRLKLVNNLEILATQLWSIGITGIYVDGSFVEDKDHPKDIDAYFETTLYHFGSGQVSQQLNAIEPIWAWASSSRRPHPQSAKRELPMWHKYRVEFWPQYLGCKSGLKDEFGNDLPIAAAFRRSRRNDRPRGVIKLEAT